MNGEINRWSDRSILMDHGGGAALSIKAHQNGILL